MMNNLINHLNAHLLDCEKFGVDNFSTAKTYFDQAFGMVLMFTAIYPDLAEQVTCLWDEKYRPEFEKIVYERS